MQMDGTLSRQVCGRRQSLYGGGALRRRQARQTPNVRFYRIGTRGRNRAEVPPGGGSAFAEAPGQWNRDLRRSAGCSTTCHDTVASASVSRNGGREQGPRRRAIGTPNFAIRICWIGNEKM